MSRAIYTAACAAVAAIWAFNCLHLSLLDLQHRVVEIMARRSTQAVLAVSLAAATYGQQQQVLDLSNVDWTLTSPNYTYISVPGKLPSQAHLDLYAANVGF